MTTTPDAAFEPQALLEQLPFIRALARQLVEDPAAAEDVTQDAVVAALERQHPAATLRPWLLGVTRNLARLLFRREARRSNRERAAAAREILPSAGDESVRFEALRRVVLALDHLAPDERALLVRRFYDEWPPRRIAVELGIPVNTVRTRIARALANLRRELVGARPQDERRNLRALLIPLLTPPAASSLVPFVPLVAGGLLVSTKVKLALAAALVVAASVGIAIWSAGREGAPPAAADARSTPLPAETAAATATADARRETTVDAPRTVPAAEAPRVRIVALRGRLFGEPGALARWTTPVEVVASTEVARNGRVATPPAPDRLHRSIAVAADGTFAAELPLDGAAPRIGRLALKGADPAFAPFERRFAVPFGAADLAWNVEARLFETAVVRGHVVDADGAPIPDGAVAAFALRGGNAELLGETLVDADGDFALGVSGSSPCFVVATQRQVESGTALAKAGRRDAPGLVPAVLEATPTVGRETDLGDLVLRPGVAIRGRVEWFAHGPVAGVRVSARPFVRTTPPTEEFDLPAAGSAYAIARLARPVLLPSGLLARADATTDERGEFEIAGLPPGPAHVRVATFLRGMMCGGFLNAPTLEIDAPSDSLLLRFDGGLVEFEVTSRGRPLEGAMVSTGIPNATWRATWNDAYVTGPEGLVESVLPPGVDADWFADAWGHVGARDNRFRSPAAGERVRIHVELEPVETKPSLIVRLTDEAGAPVTTAGFQWERVRSADDASTPKADRSKRSIGGAEPCAPDGRFVLNDMATDTYQLRIRPGGSYRAGDGCYAEIARDVTVRADRVEEIALVAVAAGRLRAAARDGRGRFLGAILQVHDEKGVEVPTQAILRQETENGEWTSDWTGDHLSPDGFCRIDPPLAPGRYTATFTLAGFAPKTVGFEIEPLQPYDLEVVLDPLR
jgi:RNA polymerase sigma-70 factor (ECF subfamily)